ncbi:hypothetical protein HKD37_15G043773 [Glycine soja]
MASFSQLQSQMQSQGPPEPLVGPGPSGPRVSTKGSCVDPSGNDPETGDSDRCGLYIEADPACLVAVGRVYEGSTLVHNTPLLPGQVKVSVDEVKDAHAAVPVPTAEKCMRAGNSDIYGFLEPQSIQRFHCSGHWQMVVILPKEHLVVWFCSLHNRPDNYLKGIINSAIKGLDVAPQPKSKAPARWIVVKCNRQKGTIECGYYVMHWMSTIILGSFRNNREAYFNDPRPLEPERLKALRIQWAQFYLRVRDQA